MIESPSAPLRSGIDADVPEAPAREPIPAEELDVARENAREGLFGKRQARHRVGRFVLLGPVGHGGMGTVYAARDEDLDRRVAVKLLVPSGTDQDSATAQRRMLAEARAMAKVSHPNVVNVYEVGLHASPDGGSAVFVAMEFVEGSTLRTWVDREAPGWERVVAAYAAAGRGLAAVHAAGLVHRDFKPDNVMLGDDGRVRLMDFGLARQDDTVEATPAVPSATTEAIGRLTQTGALLGTPAYMAPEQFQGRAADACSDQYAFCVSLYEALWGQRPHSASTPLELVTKVLSTDRVDVPSGREVPRRVRKAVARGLMRSSSARWPSMTSLVDALTVNRARRRVLTVGALGVGAAAVTWLATPVASQQPCEGGAAAFEPVWGAQRARTLQAAFATVPRPFARAVTVSVTRQLDNYASVWLSQHRQTCQAGVRGEQSEDRLDRRMRCLDRRRTELDAVVSIFMQPDAQTIARADEAVSGLVSPGRCGDATFVDATHEPPADLAVLQQVEDLRNRITRADAAYAVGDNVVALAELEAALVEAEAVGYAPLQARALVHAARVAAATRKDYGPEIERLQRGYFAAQTARLPLLAATAALEVSSMRATADSEYGEARRWLRLAQAEVQAFALDDLGTSLLSTEASIAEHEGDYATAIVLQQRNLVATKARCGVDCEALIELHESLSALYANRDQLAESIEHATVAVAMARHRYGPDHVALAGPLLRLGEAQRSHGWSDKAVASLQQGLELRERQLGPSHMNVAGPRAILGNALIDAGRVEAGIMALERARDDARHLEATELTAAVLNRLGDAYSDVDRLDEARSAFAEALDTMRTLHPDGHPALSILWSNLAYVEDKRGDREAALEGFRASLALRRVSVPEPDPQQARFLSNVGKTLLALDRHSEAILPLREAVDQLETQPLTLLGVEVGLSLAQALQPTDRAAAMTAIDKLRARCDAAPPLQVTVAGCGRIERWLADHGLSSGSDEHVLPHTEGPTLEVGRGGLDRAR